MLSPHTMPPNRWPPDGEEINPVGTRGGRGGIEINPQNTWNPRGGKGTGITATSMRSDYPGAPNGTPIGMIVQATYAAIGSAGFWPRMPQHDPVPVQPIPNHPNPGHHVHDRIPHRPTRKHPHHTKKAPYPGLHTGSSTDTSYAASLPQRGGSDVPFPTSLPPVYAGGNDGGNARSTSPPVRVNP